MKENLFECNEINNRTTPSCDRGRIETLAGSNYEPYQRRAK